MALTKVGIQLLIFGKREKEDFEGVLRDCRKAGYSSIETNVLFDTYSCTQLRETSEKYGLEYAAIHAGFDIFREQKNVDKLIKDSVDVGARYLICSGVGKDNGLNGFKEAASLFNYVGKKCKDASLIFCYHNHSFEFEEFDGIKGIDLLGKETNPEFVKFAIDIAWVYIGGGNLEEFIKKYENRCGYYHFKDALLKGNPPIPWNTVLERKAIIWMELGKGEVDLAGAYKAIKKYNLEYIVYEQDATQISALEAIIDSKRYLKSLGI